jgi:ADP-ribose pyrophosphatase YjhB (NUDIX family)
MNEKEFLQQYDASVFAAPLFSVDAVMFSYHQKQLFVLLVQRSNHPDQDKWGLPGGFVDLSKDADIEAVVIRKLREKTGVVPPYIEQLLTVGNGRRDKRGWSVTTCYTALMPMQMCASTVDSVADVSWVPVEKLDAMTLAFDHAELITQGLERLRQKALYSIVPAFALPEKFTLPELQQLHEILIGKSIQKKSFRRRIEQADILLDTGEKRTERGRPASLYSVKPNGKTFNFVRNLES